jgi:phenylacetic acid degradation operon negative regulatory protein
MSSVEHPFRHARFCPRVALRHLAADLLDILAEGVDILATRGRSIAWNRSRPSETAYRMAQYRLERAGLIARQRDGGRRPILALTEAGEAQRDPVFRPEPLWNARWRGTWSLLVYDVPEKDRGYRNVLRRFLKRMRMGCLQNSVWISPRDIRPEYDDLATAVAVDDVAVLFEARSLLGHTPRRIVEDAWDFDTLAQAHRWYIGVAGSALNSIREQGLSRDALLDLARREIYAYRSVTAGDPLLPHELWPPGYLGKQALRAHKDFQRGIARLL